MITLGKYLTTGELSLKGFLTIYRFRTRLEFWRIKLNISYLIKKLINREKNTIEVFGCATYIMYNQRGFRLRYLRLGYLALDFSFFVKNHEHCVTFSFRCYLVLYI